MRQWRTRSSQARRVVTVSAMNAKRRGKLRADGREECGHSGDAKSGEAGRGERGAGSQAQGPAKGATA